MARLSTRYATAFFDLAVERGTVDALISQVIAAKDYLSDDDFKNFINHPNISKDEKYKFLDDTFANAFLGGIHADLKSFLHLLVTKSRESIMLAALGEFVRMANNFNRKTVAHVTTATPLTEAQTQQVKSDLSAKLGKQIELTIDVDPSLIGGVMINVDGLLIDQSVKNQLAKLASAIS